jgi:hypothetical protein
VTDWGDVPRYPTVDVTIPLFVRGDPVAWVKKSRGGRLTIGLSLVHRVFEDGETYCLEKIPGADRLVPPLHTMKPCRVCDENYANQASFVDIVRASSQVSQGAA